MALCSSSALAGEEPEDCDVYYYGIGRARDLKRAFTCEMRAPDENKNWMRLTVMHLNGEGTPASLEQARAAFKHVSERDASTEAMEKALALRVANPNAAFPRIDFCKEIAQTTLDGNDCDAIRQRRADAGAGGALKAVRGSLDRAGAKRFDELKRAFDAFRKADGERMYQAFIDGSIRNEKAMAQEDFVQRNFLAAIEAWGPKAAAPPPPRRSLADADGQLNKVYRELLDPESAKVTEAVRIAQRLWLKYAAAWKTFAEPLRPDKPAAGELRAFLIEQRIRELQFSGKGSAPKK
jgi:uncharacterized protein YecT (DUF1311 family)